jgi:hypothetical protein
VTTTTTTPRPFDLQAAIDACPAGGTVTIPAGTWTIPEVNLKSNITVRGSGRTSVLVSSATYPLVIEGKTGIVLDGFVLRGNYSAGQAGILFATAQSSNISIMNLEISDMGFAGVYLSITGSLVNSRITGCNIHDMGNHGIASRGPSSNLLIENCVLRGFAGIDDPPHGVYLHNANDLIIRGVEVYELGLHNYGWSGIELDNSLRVLVENTYAHDCRVGSATGGGYGYIAVGATTVTYRNSRGGNNYYDFYEYSLSGSATYESSPGTKIAD